MRLCYFSGRYVLREKNVCQLYCGGDEVGKIGDVGYWLGWGKGVVGF